MVRNFLCSTALVGTAFFLNTPAALGQGYGSAPPPPSTAPTVTSTAPVATECAPTAVCAPTAPAVVCVPPCVPCPQTCAPVPLPPAPPFTLETPVLKISGTTSVNMWGFQNKRRIVNDDRNGSPCGLQRFGLYHLLTVDDSRLRFAVDGKLDTGMEYGLVFAMDGNVNATRTLRENYIFFGGSWGKLVVGNTFGVQSTMSFFGGDQWGGTNFIDGPMLRRVVNVTTGVFDSVNFVGDTNRDTKVSYYSPRWEGFQFGISYTPRSEHRGEEPINSITSTVSPKRPFDTDNIANGINFIHKFESGFEMALSATSVVAGRTHPEFQGAPHRRRTFSYAFGGTFSYEGFGVSGEWANNTRSREIENRKTNSGQFMDFGLSYTWGATKFSTGYYQSWRKALAFGRRTGKAKTGKAKLHAYSAAVDQKLAPGLGIYIEYAHFNMNNRRALGEARRFNEQREPCGGFVGGVPSNRANVFVVGSRLVF